VTDRDRVVAEIIPPSAGRADRLADAQLAALLRDGLLRPPLESHRTGGRRLPAPHRSGRVFNW